MEGRILDDFVHVHFTRGVTKFSEIHVAFYVTKATNMRMSTTTAKLLTIISLAEYTAYVVCDYKVGCLRLDHCFRLTMAPKNPHRCSVVGCKVVSQTPKIECSCGADDCDRSAHVECYQNLILKGKKPRPHFEELALDNLPTRVASFGDTLRHI